MPDPESVLRRLDWTVIRRLDGLLQGDYQTLFRGFGLDLADLREYQFGDDVRYIDWNSTARLQTPYIREYMEDRQATVWFLVDLSPSLDFGSTDSGKRGTLVDVVGVLARLLTRHGNRVGAILYTDRAEQVIPPLGGRAQVLRLVDELQRRRLPARAALTNLTPLIEAASRTFQRRAIVFVVSDFISVPGWAAPLALLARRHEVVGVRLSDPLECELPDVGPLIVEDAETGEQLYIDTHDRGFRARFADAALRRQHDIEVACSHAGVELLSISTADDLLRSIVRFVLLRQRRRRGAAQSARSRMGSPPAGSPAAALSR